MKDTEQTKQVPSVECEQHHACLAVSDVRSAVEFYTTKLGLHTCEPLGDGVASPHTKRTLDYIQQLKQKHGIEHDCHASYRFVERD